MVEKVKNGREVKDWFSLMLVVFKFFLVLLVDLFNLFFLGCVDWCWIVFFIFVKVLLRRWIKIKFKWLDFGFDSKLYSFFIVVIKLWVGVLRLFKRLKLKFWNDL